MDAQSLDTLAMAARQHILDPSTREPLYVPASPWKRLGAGLADIVGAALIAFCTGCVGLIGAMAVFNTDFDGPGQLDALSDWYLFAFFGIGFLICGCVEIFGGRTFGMLIFDLRLISLDENSRRRSYLRRWLFKMSPVLVYTVVCMAGVFHTHLLGTDGFDDFGWSAGWDVLAALVLPAIVVFVAFLQCFNADRQSTYDRASQFFVVSERHPGAADQRGFEVLSVVPAISGTAGLERPAPGGYPPSAGHE